MCVKPDSLDIYGQNIYTLTRNEMRKGSENGTLFGPPLPETLDIYRRKLKKYQKTSKTNCYIEMYVWMFAVNIEQTGV